MLPTFRAGDFVVVDTGAWHRALTPRPRLPTARERGGRMRMALGLDRRAGTNPRAGDVVVARTPTEPARDVIKRVRHVDSDGRIWLQGDNAEASTDSRDYGPVEADAIVGRVLFRYWPLRRS